MRVKGYLINLTKAILSEDTVNGINLIKHSFVIYSMSYVRFPQSHHTVVLHFYFAKLETQPTPSKNNKPNAHTPQKYRP